MVKVWGNMISMGTARALQHRDPRTALDPTPFRRTTCAIVRDPVSLRDLPGPSSTWSACGRGTLSGPLAVRPVGQFDHRWIAPRHEVLSEIPSPNPRVQPWSIARSPWPAVSLAAGDLVYIHNEGDGTEELYDERDDPGN